MLKKKKNEIIQPIKIYNQCQNKNLSIDLLDFFSCSNIRLFQRKKNKKINYYSDLRFIYIIQKLRIIISKLYLLKYQKTI